MIYIYTQILLGTRSIGIRMNFKHWFLVLPTHWAAGAGLAGRALVCRVQYIMRQKRLRQLERFCAQAAPVINEALWVVAAVPFCAVLLEQWGGQLLSRALELQENLVTLVTLEVQMVKWEATDWDVMSTEMWCLGLKNEAPVDPQFG